jgi:hypothetical protein
LLPLLLLVEIEAFRLASTRALVLNFRCHILKFSTRDALLVRRGRKGPP